MACAYRITRRPQLHTMATLLKGHPQVTHVRPGQLKIDLIQHLNQCIKADTKVIAILQIRHGDGDVNIGFAGTETDNRTILGHTILAEGFRLYLIISHPRLIEQFLNFGAFSRQGLSSPYIRT